MNLALTWEARLKQATDPLPGLQPYQNFRRFGVGGAFDQAQLGEFLARRHPHIEIETWERAAREGRLSIDGRPVHDLQCRVRAGNVLSHRIDDCVEPLVATNMRLLFEDADFLAIDKPAPLPVHPSGRFNRHSVQSFLQRMYPDLDPKPVHRIDADTTGVLMLARTAKAARQAAQLFRDKQVEKTYLARVRGRWDSEHRKIDASIGRSPVDKGARASDSAAGLASTTAVELLAHLPDHTSLLQVRPRTGRTNQIRLHLAHSGHPIIGDQAYGDAGTKPAGAFTTGSLCLHAYQLTMPALPEHPGLKLEAAPPDWARR